MNDKYNGWTNYETWNVKLWMDNDEGSYRHYEALAQSVYDNAAATEIFTRLEQATYTLADQLKDEYESASCDILEAVGQSASVWSDLLSSALAEVNWQEIAEHLLDDVDTDTDTDTEISDLSNFEQGYGGRVTPAAHRQGDPRFAAYCNGRLPAKLWEVIVGNVGLVYSGDSERDARMTYNTYCDRSEGSTSGRCAGEDVTLLCDSEPVAEHSGHNPTV